MSLSAGVRQRTGVAVVVPLVVVLIFAAALWIIYQNEQSYRQEQARAGQVQAEILAASVVAALDFADRSAAQEAVDALQVSPQLRAVGIYDAHGRRFAGYHRTGARLPDLLGDAVPPDASLIQATAPVTRGGATIGSVYLANAVDPLSRRLSRYAMIALLVVMTSLVLAVLGHSQAELRGVNRRLESQAQTLAEANSELQFQMEERSRTEEQLRQAQKMQALGQLTGGIAHDFNNLMTVIQGSADLLLRPNLTEERRLRFVKAIIEGAERAALLTGQLLAFARRQPLRPELLDINKRIETMIVMLQPTLGPDITLTLELEEELPCVEVDPGQFEAALLNLVVNARDAMPEGGTLTIATRSVEDGDVGEHDRAVAISVKDSGIGISPEVRDRVFEPFYTTKTVGKGTGLGLSQVYGFAAQSGGGARIESEVGKGTTLTILLPASTRRLPLATGEARVARKRRAGRILLVEDNEEVGNFAETMLFELGHEVVRARSGPEALGLADKGASFDVVFTDVVMPGMTGIELAGELKQRRPRLPIILTTGYSDKIVAAGSQGFPVVTKPYRLETLASTLDEALGARRVSAG